MKKQAQFVKDKIEEMQTVLHLVNALHEEVIVMKQVNFKKYADIIMILKSDNAFYWTYKFFDEKMSAHLESHFSDNEEEAMRIYCKHIRKYWMRRHSCSVSKYRQAVNPVCNWLPAVGDDTVIYRRCHEFTAKYYRIQQ